MLDMLLVYVSVTVLIALLIPSIAYAWGPGMHVEIAMAALVKLSLFAPFIREVVKRFPDAFIYGAASPDIIVGKKYAGYHHHCHNWRVGRLILEEATSARQRAAAYGYLTHLAADVVAHNYYIPANIVRSHGTRLLSHTYWEMRFDLGVSEEAWERLEMVTEFDIKEFDQLLERVLRKTIFSFQTNKRIFTTILMIHRMKRLRKSLKLYAKHSRFDLAGENRQHYYDLAMELAMEFLMHPEDAGCLDMDPAGLRCLAYAKNMRNGIRKMIRKGLVSEEGVKEFAELIKEQLVVGLFRPEMKLPAIADIAKLKSLS